MAPQTPELITAVSHPLRRRILRIYLDGPLEHASAGQLARTIDQEAGKVSYHLKTLARCEVLRPVRTEATDDGDFYGWALDVEADWLRVVLDFWSEARRR